MEREDSKLPQVTKPTLREMLFGNRYAWPLMIASGLILLAVSVYAYEETLAINWPFILGGIGFLLLFSGIGIAIVYVSTTLTGERKVEMETGRAEPDGLRTVASYTIGAILMFAMGVLLAFGSWPLLENVLPDAVIGIFVGAGFLLALFSVHWFATGLGTALLFPLWKYSWFRIFAYGSLILIFGAGLFMFLNENYNDHINYQSR